MKRANSYRVILIVAFLALAIAALAAHHFIVYAAERETANRESAQLSKGSAALVEPIPDAGGETTEAVTNGKIAFVRDGNRIYKMNADGSNQVPFFATHLDVESYPAWSPDGTKLAFVSRTNNGRQEIYVANADGSAPSRLTTDPDASELNDIGPTWSPDGNKIAWQRSPQGATFHDIYVMDAVDLNNDGNGDNRVKITDLVGSNITAGRPSWSPDGTKIAFTRSFAGGSNQIAIMNADGSNQAPVPTTGSGPNGDDDAAWSPDGSKILFKRGVSGAPQILVVNVNGSGFTEITNNVGSSQKEPAWSPDGTKITFNSDQIAGGDKEIYVMNADGSNQTRLTNYAGTDEWPTWQAVGPANDMIQAPQLLTGSAGLALGDNRGATRQSTNFFTAFDQPVEPLHNGKYGGKSVWYQWTAPADGTVRFWIDPSSLDSLLAVYNVVTVAPIQGITTTTVNLFPMMASNDDFDFNQSNKQLSLVSFRAKKDAVYYVAVDSVGSAGPFTLNWSQISQTLTASGIGARISGLLDTGGKSLVAVQAGRTAPLTVVITGSGFAANSEVLVNEDVCRGDASNNCISGTLITTTFQNSSNLTATVPPFYFSSTGDLIFTVRTGNQLAWNRGIVHVSCIDVYQPQPGQTVNANGPSQCQKPRANYSLASTNNTSQTLTYTVNILDVIDRASRELASSPNIGAFNSAIGLNLLIANGMRAGYGLPPLSLPLALPGGQVLGDTAINISVAPNSLLTGVADLLYKPDPLIGHDGSSLIGHDGSSINRAGATIVAGGAGNILATDGATILATDGATVVAGGAGNILATDGATFGAFGGNSPTNDLNNFAETDTTTSSSNPLIPNDVNSPTSRTGWYVFPDAQGGNSNLKGTTNPDGSVSLEAHIKIDTTTLPRIADINKTAFAIVLNPSFINFSQSAYTVSEGAGSVTVTVRRSNNLTDSAIVGYSTTSRAEPEFAAPAGTASDRSDYSSATGSLFFAPGETEKTFTVFITDDGLGGADDGASETFNILLNNAYGAAVDGPGFARVTITDNDTSSATTNAIDGAQFFVRQHYIDFLNREPDASGLQFWANQVAECEGLPVAQRQGCREVRRINVSAAFFLSIEFQETGFLVSRLHAASFGNFPASLSQRDFFLGARFIGRDVVVGASGWEAKLEANKQAFLSFWITRPEFMAIYAGKTNDDYINTLFANAGVTGSQETTLRGQLITGLNNGSETRASALRKVAESASVSSRLLNPSFVLVQYMGYLRRHANETPDSNLDGYNFWLGKLNQFNGDFQAAEMVKAFITSGEYRGRFGKN